MSTFGENLREARTKQKMTQADLAEKLFLSAQSVSKWEKSETSPDVETIKKISIILDCDPNLLFGFTSGHSNDAVFEKQYYPHTKIKGSILASMFVMMALLISGIVLLIVLGMYYNLEPFNYVIFMINAFIGIVQFIIVTIKQTYKVPETDPINQKSTYLFILNLDAILIFLAFQICVLPTQYGLTSIIDAIRSFRVFGEQAFSMYLPTFIVQIIFIVTLILFYFLIDTSINRKFRKSK